MPHQIERMRKFIAFTALLITVTFASAQNTDSVYNTKNSAQTLIAAKSGKLLMAAYGEAHYNQPVNAGKIQNGNMDIHRQVLLFGYKFNSKTSFITEIEMNTLRKYSWNKRS